MMMKAPHDDRRTQTLSAIAQALPKRLPRISPRILRQRLAAADAAILAVSGGNTPKLMFDHLSRQDLAWDRVTITLVDERQVPITSDRSNARLVSRASSQEQGSESAIRAAFDNVAAASAAAAFDAVVLGMGDDGHTASFFPARRQSRQGARSCDAASASSPCGRPMPASRASPSH